MGDSELRLDQFKELADLLDSARRNKELIHPHDLRLAAVLIFSVLQKGYYFKDHELEKIMQLSGNRYSKLMIKTLKEITWVCNELVEGLNDVDSAIGKYKLKHWKRKKKHRIVPK